MRIDIFSDVVCPWCFVGKRHLEQALAGAADAEIRWHAYQLNPDLPAEGVDRRQYLAAKFGAQAERIHDRVQAAGRAAGIEFRFDRIQRSPNTFDAHRLLWLAGTQGRQDALKEALFGAYFLEGLDIGDRGVLAAVGARAGLESDDLGAFLAGEGGRSEVHADLGQAARLQITGVPFFIFNGRYALAGAQPPDIFRQALDTARAGSPAQPIG